MQCSDVFAAEVAGQQKVISDIEGIAEEACVELLRHDCRSDPVPFGKVGPHDFDAVR